MSKLECFLVQNNCNSPLNCIGLPVYFALINMADALDFSGQCVVYVFAVN